MPVSVGFRKNPNPGIAEMTTSIESSRRRHRRGAHPGALTTVFAIADDARAHETSDADSEAITSLPLLGVLEPRATTVVAARRLH